MAEVMSERVKVYKLSDSGEWVDKGTGTISVEYMDVRRGWMGGGGGGGAAACAHTVHACVQARCSGTARSA